MKTHFNIIPPCAPRYPKWFLPLGFPNQNSALISISILMRDACPDHPTLLDSITLIITLWSSSLQVCNFLHPPRTSSVFPTLEKAVEKASLNNPRTVDPIPAHECICPLLLAVVCAGVSSTDETTGILTLVVSRLSLAASRRAQSAEARGTLFAHLGNCGLWLVTAAHSQDSTGLRRHVL